MKATIKGVTFKLVNGEIPMEEAEAYVDRGLEMYGDRLTGLALRFIWLVLRTANGLRRNPVRSASG